MDQVFISYSRKDLAFVEQLAADLKKAGLNVWYDVSGIGGGSRWRMEIENALRNSQYVVVVLSPDSIASEWVEREFIFSSNLNRKIIPLMYRSCELPLNYVDLNYIDVQGNNYEQNFEKLLQALKIEKNKDALDEVKQQSQPKRQGAFLIGGTIILAALLGLYLVINKNSLDSSPTAIGDVTREPATVEVTSTTVALTPTITPLAPEITDERGVIMALVPADTFTMGSEIGNEDERPSHSVYLDAYYLDRYEVSNMLYDACVGSGNCLSPVDKSSYGESSYYGNPSFYNYPVVNVTWNMAKTYCEWRGARLPTEAEWEKALRGEGDDAPAGGVGADKVNFCDRTCPLDWTNQDYDDGFPDAAPVNAFSTAISPYGFYNLPGNVWEWVQDWYGVDYYQNSPKENPSGPTSGKYRVIRGGSYGDVLDYTRIARRSKFDPAMTTPTLGFRCAKDALP